MLLAHVTGMNRVLFTYSWLYDGGIHYYPSVEFDSNIIQDNFKLKLTMRNITDRRTGRWDVYAVSEVYQRYSDFRRGAVWAKVVVPNIPVTNGVVHIVDSVLGIVSNTIDQLLMENYQCTTLMQYVNTIGQVIRTYFSATGGMVTFFAPINEAFERIPEQIERRLLRDRIWLEQIMKLHIVPAKELTGGRNYELNRCQHRGPIATAVLYTRGMAEEQHYVLRDRRRGSGGRYSGQRCRHERYHPLHRSRSGSPLPDYVRHYQKRDNATALVPDVARFAVTVHLRSVASTDTRTERHLLRTHKRSLGKGSAVADVRILGWEPLPGVAIRLQAAHNPRAGASAG